MTTPNQPVATTKGTDWVDAKNACVVGVNMGTFVNATASNTALNTDVATANGGQGIITSSALTTAATTVYSLTVTNSVIAATDILNLSVQNGTNTSGTPTISTYSPGAGTFSVLVNNTHTTGAISGTLKICYQVLKAAPAQF